MEDDDFRSLSIIERRMLHAMISTELPDGEILIRQIDSSRVKAIDEVGSLKFSVSCDELYDDVSGPLITAQQEDVDTVPGCGPYINFLLFLRDGVVDELEVYKDDGGRILSTFDPSKFALTWGLPPKK